MRTLTIGFMILSGLFGITVGSLAFIVGLVAYADEERALIIVLVSFIYLLHPALIYWLFRKSYETLALSLSAIFMLCSIALSFLN
jgi:hypothetical protein